MAKCKKVARKCENIDVDLTILTWKTCPLLKKFIEIQGWLLLRFFICLHNQLCSFNSIIVQMSEKRDSSIFFSTRVFFHGHWGFTEHHSTTSTRSRTFRHLFSTLHVRWLSHIFNRITCIYQTATRWDLPLYRVTIWLIDDVTLSFCLFTWRFDSSFFVTATWDGKPLASATSEPTNQVC